MTTTPGGAQNPILLAVGLVIFTTVVNMIGVKLMARINKRRRRRRADRRHAAHRPSTGSTPRARWPRRPTTRASTRPRRSSPAICAAAVCGGLLILVALMAVNDINAKEIPTTGLRLVNLGNQRAFFVLTSVAIILFYLAYLSVTGPLLFARLRGDWPRPDHGPYFSLGRWGLLVNVAAVLHQCLAIVNLAWPRADVYGGDHWYFQYGAFVVCGIVAITGGPVRPAGPAGQAGRAAARAPRRDRGRTRQRELTGGQSRAASGAAMGLIVTR